MPATAVPVSALPARSALAAHTTLSLQARAPRMRRDSPQARGELRQAIVDAALTLYQQRGLQGLTMRAVAADVGVSPMALYRYFTDKAELLAAMGEFAMHEVQQAVSEAIAGLTSARERLRASTRAFIAYWEAHADHYRLVYVEAEPGSPLNAPHLNDSAVYAQLLALSTGQLQALADEMGLPHHRVALARDLRLVMMLGYLQASMAVTRYPWHDKAALRDSVVEATLQATAACLAGDMS